MLLPGLTNNDSEDDNEASSLSVSDLKPPFAITEPSSIILDKKPFEPPTALDPISFEPSPDKQNADESNDGHNVKAMSEPVTQTKLTVMPSEPVKPDSSNWLVADKTVSKVTRKNAKVAVLSRSKKIDKPSKLTHKAKMALKKLSSKSKSAIKKSTNVSAPAKNPKRLTKPSSTTTNSTCASDKSEESKSAKKSKSRAQKETTSKCPTKPSASEKKYYQNFDFYFKRTSFRTMTLYFKTQYKPFFEEWKNKKENPSVLDSLVKFAKDEFPGLLESFSEKARFEFIELVKLLVFSHRHNKNDDYLKDPLIDFEIIRQPMYKYSQAAQNKFFDYPTFAFLFAWFQAKPSAQSFSQEKFAENESANYPERMTNEIT